MTALHIFLVFILKYTYAELKWESGYVMVMSDYITDNGVMEHVESVGNSIHCASKCLGEAKCIGFGYGKNKTCFLMDVYMSSGYCTDHGCMEMQGFKIFMRTTTTEESNTTTTEVQTTTATTTIGPPRTTTTELTTTTSFLIPTTTGPVTTITEPTTTTNTTTAKPTTATTTTTNKPFTTTKEPTTTATMKPMRKTSAKPTMTTTNTPTTTTTKKPITFTTVKPTTTITTTTPATTELTTTAKQISTTTNEPATTTTTTAPTTTKPATTKPTTTELSTTTAKPISTTTDEPMTTTTAKPTTTTPPSTTTTISTTTEEPNIVVVECIGETDNFQGFKAETMFLSAGIEENICNGKKSDFYKDNEVEKKHGGQSTATCGGQSAMTKISFTVVRNLLAHYTVTCREVNAIYLKFTPIKSVTTDSMIADCGNNYAVNALRPVSGSSDDGQPVYHFVLSCIELQEPVSSDSTG